MRLFEHEAKALLRREGIPVTAGALARTPDEARDAAARAGGEVVLKAQILRGGRGKAGGIQFAKTPDEAFAVARKLLGSTLLDLPVDALLVEPRLAAAREFYLGVTIDRARYKIVVLACGEGGVEIEETARRAPEKIHRVELSIDQPLYPHEGIRLAKAIGVPAKALRAFGTAAAALHRLFVATDAKLLEINPFALLADGQLIALDARMNIDEDALFRHAELTAMGIEPRHEEGNLTPREIDAREKGIPYVDLDGDIGMFPGGAGFGILGNDFITHYGGQPANFMDSGGGPTPERLAAMLQLLEENPRVKAIFGARFGGISRCDDFAKGLVLFLETHGLSKPMALRMTGNMWQEGLEILKNAKAANPRLFEKIEMYGIETPIETVCERAVAFAREASGVRGA